MQTKFFSYLRKESRKTRNCRNIEKCRENNSKNIFKYLEANRSSTFYHRELKNICFQFLLMKHSMNENKKNHLNNLSFKIFCVGWKFIYISFIFGKLCSCFDKYWKENLLIFYIWNYDYWADHWLLWIKVFEMIIYSSWWFANGF